MPDSVVTEVACKYELSRRSSVLLDVGASSEAKCRQEAALDLWAHTLPCSAKDVPGGSNFPEDTNEGKSVIWELTYCELKADVNSNLNMLPRTKFPKEP